jgi:hypothetical protein
MTERERKILEELEHALSLNRDLPKEETFSRIAHDLGEKIQDVHSRIDEIHAVNVEHWKKMEPVIEFYESGMTLRKVFILMLKGLGLMAAGILAFKLLRTEMINFLR